MSEVANIQEQVTPLWTENKLTNVLEVQSPGIDSKVKKRRDAVARYFYDNDVDYPTNTRRVLTYACKWKDGEVILSFWAGHIEKGNEIRTNENHEPLTSVEQVEESMIERFGQPAYNETEMNIEQLTDAILPLMRVSPVTNCRPEIWEDDPKARDRIHQALERHMESKTGYNRT